MASDNGDLLIKLLSVDNDEVESDSQAIDFKLGENRSAIPFWNRVNKKANPLQRGKSRASTTSVRLVAGGCDDFVVTWDSSSAEFNPESLFGKKFVPLSQLFLVYQSSEYHFLKKSMSFSSQYSLARTVGGDSISTLEMRRKMIADYFIRQLYLFGAMCLGRNYVSMNLIKEVIRTSPFLHVGCVYVQPLSRFPKPFA